MACRVGGYAECSSGIVEVLHFVQHEAGQMHGYLEIERILGFRTTSMKYTWEGEFMEHHFGQVQFSDLVMVRQGLEHSKNW